MIYSGREKVNSLQRQEKTMKITNRKIMVLLLIAYDSSQSDLTFITKSSTVTCFATNFGEKGGLVNLLCGCSPMYDRLISFFV